MFTWFLYLSVGGWLAYRAWEDMGVFVASVIYGLVIYVIYDVLRTMIRWLRIKAMKE